MHLKVSYLTYKINTATEYKHLQHTRSGSHKGHNYLVAVVDKVKLKASIGTGVEHLTWQRAK